MENKPVSPFGNLNRLDTTLIRSTKRDPPPSITPQQSTSETTPAAMPPTPPHKSSSAPATPTSIIGNETELNGRTDERTNDQMAERTNGRTATWSSGQTAERPNGRPLIRHGFDIFADQLESLKDIRRAREKRLKKKVTLGQLAQEALESFIHHETTEQSS